MDAQVKAALLGAVAVIAAAFIPVAFSEHWIGGNSPSTPTSSPAISFTLPSIPQQTSAPAHPNSATTSGSVQAQTACTPPPNGSFLCLEPSSGSAGQSVTAIATRFSPDIEVQFYFQGALVGQAISNSEGTARFSFAVPSFVSGFPIKTFTVSASDANANSAEAVFTAT
jgi:hypothetical protein